MPALVQIMQGHPQWQVRQLAAVEVQKRCSKYYDQLDAATQASIRDIVSQAVLNETESSTLLTLEEK